MGRAGAKRSKQVSDDSPTSGSATKKRKTDKKKIAPKKVDREESMDPYLKSLCERFKNPEDSLQFLLQNSKTAIDDFFKNHWGSKPLHIEAPEASEELSKIFSLEVFEEIVSRSEKGDLNLIADRDFTFSKIVDGDRQDLEIETLTKDLVKNHYKEKYAIQINQPQRFQDCLWSFIEKLECHLGSLVSSQVFLVPGDTKNQQRRYDDTEKFVLQLSGSSSWKLHELKGEMVCEFDDALKEENVGDQIMAANLKAGDVLYFPKTTIFESEGVTDGAHIVFSTFQGMHRANLLLQTIIATIEEQVPVCEELRKGLPFHYLPRANSISNADYADTLVKLAESVRSRSKPLPPADGMIQEFMTNRLPPYGQPKFELESGSITSSSKISFRNKEHITWFVRKAEDAEMDEGDGVDEENVAESQDLTSRSELVVMSSMNNDRSRHMMIDATFMGSEDDSGAFTISLEYEELLEKLYKSEEPITVEDLLKDVKNGDALNAMTLVRGLFSIGAISGGD
ncbi:ribosomal oxygenase 2 [Galendromus occidentalis]|uniref:Bifunctional lysine-specific demethylase and histidyl-hydroxylase n=1 Tax=Galendromus occidentalis TaxID=34638 RepID=A0AAJ6VYL8_9ACAR|nr:ribosomal oxygenase 2 [Galendromus occidentalis]